jgi:hypothetical protein
MRQALIQQWYDSQEYLDKLRTKAKLLQEMETNEFLREKNIQNIYSVDPERFIEDFLFIKFSEFGGDPKPFFLFPYQKAIIRRLQQAEMQKLVDVDLLIDKPRGMGLTWLIAAYFLWRFLYTPNYSCLILSRKEDLVDDGTDLPDETIFGKIRWMMKRLPRYMVPEGFNFKKARGTTTDMTLKLINPQIGSSITGSSTNSNAGRSGRFSIIMVDECFFIDHFQQVYNSLTSVARVKVFISTTVESRVAKDFRDSCEANGTYISLTWRDHPFKDQQWYDDLVAKSEAQNNPDLMREAEVNYSINPKSRYYPEIEFAKIEPLQYDPKLPLFISLDTGTQDLTVLGWWQYDGRLKLLDAYWNRERPIKWYAPFLNPAYLLDPATDEAANGEINPEQYSEFQQRFLTKIKSWKKPIGWFGEVAHFQRVMPLNKSSAQILAQYGVKLTANTYAIEHEPRRHATAQLLPKMVFNQASDAAIKIYDALANSKYANAVRSTTENLKPIHTPEIADMRAMVENMCVNLPRVLRSQRENIPQSEVSFASALIKSIKH